MAARLMYAGAGLSALGLVLTFPSHATRVVPIGNPHTVAFQLGTILGRVLFAAVAAGLWLWMSWAVKRGKAWARVVSTVFFVLGAEPAVASLLSLRWASAVILTLATLVGMATVILLYQQDSGLFFARDQTAAGYASPAPELVPPDSQPTHPGAPRRKKLAVIAVGAAVGVVATALIGAIIADVVAGSPKAVTTSPKTVKTSPKAVTTSTAGSTASVRVIVPAPAKAGGLLRDHTEENTPGFRSALRTIRQHYQQVMHATTANIAVAIYAGAPPGTAGAPPSVTLLYIGANTPSGLAKAGTAVDLVGGAVSQMTNVSATALPGGPGDTSYECATGEDQGRTAVVCGWSTDRSLGLLIQTSPGGTVSELAALMMKMRPDLVRS